MITVKVGDYIKCNTIGHASSGIKGLLYRICDTEEDIKSGLGPDYGILNDMPVNLHNCVPLTNIKGQFHYFAHNMRHHEYKHNPLVAESLSHMWGGLILSFKGHTDSDFQMAIYLVADIGLSTDDAMLVISSLGNKQLRNEVRLEWDEMYAEAQFMSSEDRGW